MRSAAFKNRFRSNRPMKRIASFFVLVSLFSFLAQFENTNAFFSAKEVLESNIVSTGYWIPSLNMEIMYQKRHKQKNGWYNHRPCVEFEAALGEEKEGVKIFYTLTEIDFANDSCDGKNKKQAKEGKESASQTNIFLDGEEYAGKCLEIPDGKWHLQAQAVNTKNSNWRSEIQEADFSVDSKEPSIEVEDLEKDDIKKGKIDLKFELSDRFPKQYQIAVKNAENKTVFEKKSEAKECAEHKYEHAWDTTENADGEYEIEIDVFDLAGNKSRFHRKIEIQNGLEAEESKKDTEDAKEKEDEDAIEPFDESLSSAPQEPPLSQQDAEPQEDSSGPDIQTELQIEPTSPLENAVT